MKKIISLLLLLFLILTICKAQQQVSSLEAIIAAITTMKYNKLFYSEKDIHAVNLFISESDTILYAVTLFNQM